MARKGTARTARTKRTKRTRTAEWGDGHGRTRTDRDAVDVVDLGMGSFGGTSGGGAKS